MQTVKFLMKEELLFQYRKRYEVYCNFSRFRCIGYTRISFNTASGMRSIAIYRTAYRRRIA